MGIKVESTNGSIGGCGSSIDGPCAVALSSRQDNPVWEECSITSVQTHMELDGDMSVVTLEVGVRNASKEGVSGFMIPFQLTTAEIEFGGGAEPFEFLSLRFDVIGPGAEARARGQVRTRGLPKSLLLGVRL